MGDFVIHVHQDRSVKRMSRQPRIVRLTETDSDVLQSETTHPIAQAPQIFWHDIFCNYAPVGSDDRRQPHDVVAAACADVRDGHPGLDAEETHELAWFAGGVRSFSPCQIGLTISATGRSGFGKASAGAPDGAMKSWAAPRMVHAAVKASAIAIRAAPPSADMNCRRPMSIAMRPVPIGIMLAAILGSVPVTPQTRRPTGTP